MHNYRRLLVWERAHAMAVEIDRLTELMPRRNNADLISQIRRSAVSIPANIVQGSERTTDRDFGRFLEIALSSASELESHLQLAADTGKVPQGDFIRHRAELAEIRRMLVGLIRRVDPSRARA
jgi:four helix bundle protein